MSNKRISNQSVFFDIININTQIFLQRRYLILSHIQHLEPILKKMLHNYEVISSKVSTNGQSLYVTVLKQNTDYYCQFRISTHSSSSSFYSNKSFNYFGNNSDKLVEKILNYLEYSPWTSFTYADYFVLQTLKLSSKQDIFYYIDNTFGIFDNNVQSMVFYQEYNHSKYKAINLVTESFNKFLKKLFSTGLLSHYKLSEDILRLYITNAGAELLNRYTSVYSDLYEEDFYGIDWKNIALPEHTGSTLIANKE